MPRTLLEKLRTLADTRHGEFYGFQQDPVAKALMGHVDTAYERSTMSGAVREGDVWRKGICYGLSMLWLFGSKIEMGEAALAEAKSACESLKLEEGRPVGSGFLEYLVYLHVMQEDETSMLVKRGVMVPAKVRSLLSRTMGRTEDPTDALMRESGFRFFPDADGNHAKQFDLDLRERNTRTQQLFKKKAKVAQAQSLLSFIGVQHAFCYISFHVGELGGGHAMGSVGKSSGCQFFDPNWGVASFPRDSQMKNFLRWMFPYVYYWKGPGGGVAKDPNLMPDLVPKAKLKISTMTLKVRRYRKR